ncbi:MAG: Re/Si-specific NAD(P)(+) transhydrogenase subunit alpha [Pirellulaceae bacterium]
MKVAVVKETYPGERRVGLVPASVPLLIKAGLDVLVETGAGAAAGFADRLYLDKGAKIAATRDDVFAADIIVQVRSLGANLQGGRDDLSRLRSGQVLLGMCDPLGEPKAVDEIAKTGATLFALELIPRTTRAQSMDVLSSMATVIGYRAVLLAATELPKLLPMMMTAAGTLTAAKAFVIGAGVAGLQAIATAKRLGAVVRAYDLRPACREQVESVGGKFVELPLEAGDAQDKGGYAKAQGEEFYRKQRELLTKVVGESDIVITTAAIPGKPAPQLITADAVAGMHVGSVIVDLAADRGGNCALTKADERVVAHGVTILGPTNLASDAPTHASQLFSGNVTALLQHIVKNGQLELNRDDEIIRETMAAQDGQISHPRIREALGTT